ncbi:serpin family protein [Brevifollis gellanilyticus]|uniref:Serine/threonine protein kinase n=1 Tax=Brevifollis gellanilyticus TaxID=748831 RepID=A0A512MJ28_9BACT|nr:serpin family protein [Brevifollis gellanilyticus]GEP46291.1 serine/threonine protein kinase [Brevifollis gellanilyticus]
MRLSVLPLMLIISLPAWAQSASEGPNAHAWQMSHLFRQMTKGNFCFSPFSGHRVAAMLAEGARGDTQKQLLSLAHLDADAARRGTDAEALSQGLRNSSKGGGMLLDVANSLWAPPVAFLEPGYVSLLKERFGAAVQPLPAGDALASASAVNRWIRDKTNGRITDLVGPQTFAQGDGTVLAVNAVYLRAAWLRRFDPRQTRPRAFATASRSSIMLPTMARRSEFGYTEAATWQCLEIPFSSPDFAMMFLLPGADVNLETVEAALKPEAWAKVSGGLGPTELNVYLPRFNFSSQVNLQGLWQQLGVEAAFDSTKSDLTGMTPQKPCWVSQVLHEATIEVNELGAEAAAVTMSPADPFGPADSTPPPKPKVINFIANRPFLWFTVHKPSGLILFMGRFAGE